MQSRNIPTSKKKGPGRPRKEDPATVYTPVALTSALAEQLDAWAAKNGIETRSAAIRQLLTDALTAAERRTKRKDAR
jgi:hypothetical protein